MAMRRAIVPLLLIALATVTYLLLLQLFTMLEAEAAPVEDLRLLQFQDGPYARYLTEDALQVSWICRGSVQQQQLNLAQTNQIPARCAQSQAVMLHDKNSADSLDIKFSAPRVAIFSDLHGQYQVTVQLLQAHQILDSELNWSFGDGHLVLAGDLMDRGDKVTELLWLFYRLDQQAQAAGGRLHLLLGNHETMVLYNDLRYIHPKYRQVEQLLGVSYSELFNDDTVLGRWLRSKPVLVQLNDMLIMHAGVHPDYLALGMSRQEVNEAYRQSLGIPRAELMEQPLLAFLYGRLGPLWFRGYFRERDAVTAAQVEDLVQRLGVHHLVVGHTSMDGVYQHFDGRVYSVDSNIKRGESGELLLWQEGQFYRGTMIGERLPVPVFSAVAEVEE